VFVKIKDWDTCIPEVWKGVGLEFMPVYPFEWVVFPRRVGSPFLGKRATGPVTGVKGPGGVGGGVEGGDGEKGLGEGVGLFRMQGRGQRGPLLLQIQLQLPTMLGQAPGGCILGQQEP